MESKSQFASQIKRLNDLISNLKRNPNQRESIYNNITQQINKITKLVNEYNKTAHMWHKVKLEDILIQPLYDLATFNLKYTKSFPLGIEYIIYAKKLLDLAVKNKNVELVRRIVDLSLDTKTNITNNELINAIVEVGDAEYFEKFYQSITDEDLYKYAIYAYEYGFTDLFILIVDILYTKYPESEYLYDLALYLLQYHDYNYYVKLLEWYFEKYGVLPIEAIENKNTILTTLSNIDKNILPYMNVPALIPFINAGYSSLLIGKLDYNTLVDLYLSGVDLLKYNLVDHNTYEDIIKTVKSSIEPFLLPPLANITARLI